MNRKPVYKYPHFVQEVTLKKDDGKRYWLKLVFDETKKESIVIILKNPSRANKEISDKTVYNVSSYIYKNRSKHSVLKDIGSIIILNLIPHYQTYSKELKSLKSDIIDQENLDTINRFTSQNSKVIIAWGNHPENLFKIYHQLKNSVMDILVKNNSEVLYVDRLSKIGNPKHGQVWGYKNDLIMFN